jgi:hypothetical protein
MNGKLNILKITQIKIAFIAAKLKDKHYIN